MEDDDADTYQSETVQLDALPQIYPGCLKRFEVFSDDAKFTVKWRRMAIDY